MEMAKGSRMGGSWVVAKGSHAEELEGLQEVEEGDVAVHRLVPGMAKTRGRSSTCKGFPNNTKIRVFYLCMYY